MNLFPRPPAPKPGESFTPDFSEGAETGLYLALLELVDEGLVVVSDEHILELNSAACRLLERSYKELVHQPLARLFPGESAFLKARERLFIQGEMRGELEFALPDGRTSLLHFIAAPRLRPGLHAIILSREAHGSTAPAIAAQQATQDTLWARLAAVVEQPLLVLDGEHQLRAANLAAQRLLGATPRELIGRPARAFLDIQEGSDPSRPTLQTLSDGTSHPARRLPGPRDDWQLLVLPAGTPLPAPPEEQRFRRMFASCPLPILVCHPLSQRILDANPAALDLYGYTREALLELTLPVLCARPVPQSGDLLQRGGVWKLKRADGASFDAEVLSFPLEHDAVPGPLVLVHDLPGKPLLSSQLRLPLDVFRNSPQAILVCDAQTRIISVNRAFCRITGYSPNEVLGHNPNILASGRHGALFYQTMWTKLEQEGRWQGEIWNRRKSGELFPEWLSIAAVRDDDAPAHHYIGIFSDLSAHKQAEARGNYLATHDSLTGLSNMRAFEDAFATARQRAMPLRRNVGVLKVDLDSFREVNLHYDSATGDAVLKQVARRLQAALPERCLLVRKRSDAFMVLVPGADLLSQISAVGETLLSCFEEPFRVDEYLIPLTASVGASVFPEDGTELSDLLRKASTATRTVRQPGQSSFGFFTPAPDADEAELHLLAATLPHALANGQLQVHYQGQYAANSSLLGAEALLRWQHPELGLLPFARFARAMDAAHCLREAEDWVLEQACRAAAAWPMALPLTINLSKGFFLAADNARRVNAALETSGLPAQRLELDIGHKVFAEHPRAQLEAACQRLAALGVGIAMDDFGQGVTDLAVLTRLPLRRLKLEGRLAREAGSGEDAGLVVELSFAVARTLGLEVLVKGVESAAQRSFLQALGCTQLQGEVFGPVGPQLPGADV